MFKRIALDNFRSFTHIDLNLTGAGDLPKPYALIYGENGSGKTNLVESVSFLRNSMKTLVIGDEISEQRAEIQKIKRSDGDSEIMNQVFRLTDKALEELESAASSFNILESARNVRTVGADGPMHLAYSFLLDGKDAIYELTFSDDGRVSHEKLTYQINSRSGRYFELERNDGSISIGIGPSLITNRKFKAQLKDLAMKYWGNHTFLALLYAECRKANEDYISESVRPEMLRIMEYIDDLVLDFTPAGNRPQLWPFNLVSGVIPSEEEGRLDAYGNAISTFFSRLYTDVERVYYRKTSNDGKTYYLLVFRKRISEVYRDIPATSESSGTRKLLSLLPSLIECAKGAVVFIDELDSGIHDKLVHDLMAEVLPTVKGQMVVTTHNTSLIKDADPSALYRIGIDALGNKDIASFDKIARTQKSHNNTDRYNNGTFGGVPYIGLVDLEDIAEALDEELGVRWRQTPSSLSMANRNWRSSVDWARY